MKRLSLILLAVISLAAVACGAGPSSTPGPVFHPHLKRGVRFVGGAPLSPGQVLTTTNGTWTNRPTSFAYQWENCDISGANCAVISGAVARAYIVRAADSGHTLRSIVTASNTSGSASQTSAATSVVASSGVTLTAIDGGPTYYCSHGFTYACADGWDNSSFFPIGPWYGSVSTAADVTLWNQLGLNTAFRTTGNTSLSLMRSSGLYAIVDDEGSPETPGMGSETVGLLASDEPPNLAAFTGSLATTPNAQQDGRFWYLNNTWNFIQYGGLSPQGSSAAVLSQLVTTPNGTTRHDDTQSVDMYWFAGAKATNANSYGTLYQGSLLYGLSVNANTGTGTMTPAQAECGCRYGDLVDTIRGYQPTYPAPIAQFVENGGPFVQNTAASSYITPPELNWTVWSSIIHGARQIMYFNNTFAGPGNSGNDIASSYYQTPQGGQSVSIDAQTAATDSLVARLATNINSPVAANYVTVQGSAGAPNGPASTFSGIETRATYNASVGTYTIFADTRDAEGSAPGTVTFHTTDNYSGPVTVACDSRTGGDGLLNPGTCVDRTVTATNGTFTDTFAAGSTVHIYQLPPPPTLPVNTAIPSISGVTQQGSLLTASPGAWTGSPTFAYQWERCNSSGASCVNISGATAATYALALADVGATLRVIVAATNAAGTAAATSNATALIAPQSVAPTNSVLPVVTGTAQQGQTLSTTTGTWSGTAPITYTYQWKRAGVTIAGATVSTYTVVSADVGHALTVTVTATNSAGSATATSASTSTVSGGGTSANPYNTLIGVMGPTGWGATVSQFVVAAGVKWERIDVTSSGYFSGSLVDAALGYGSSVVMILPSDTSQAMSWMNAYKSYGSRILFEYMNEAYINTSPSTYASGYQATYNAKHAAGITQPLLFMTTGIGYSGAQMWLEACLAAVPTLQVDAFSSHPYGEANQDTSNKHVNGVNALIAQYQDAVNAGFVNTPWYVTEFGFSIDPSGPDANGATSNGVYAPSYAAQASVLTAAYTQLMTLPWLKLVMYYQAHDDSSGWWGLLTSPQATGHDFAGEVAGPGPNGAPPTPVITRPAWNALLTFLPSNGAG